MYCTQCGTKLPDGTPVCPNCNATFAPKEEVKVEAEAPVVMEPVMQEPEVQVEVQPEAAPQPVAPEMPEVQPEIVPEPVMPEAPQMPEGDFDPMTGQPVAPQQPKEKKPLLKNKLFLGLMAGGAALLLAIIIVVIIILQPKKVDVSKYVSIEYSGYDGYATADVYLDEWGLYAEIMEATGKRNFDYSDLDDYTDLLGNGITVAAAMDTIELTLDKEANISNGDVITATITYDNEIANEVDIEFEGETVSITAGGLETVHEVDPFDGLNVTFTGISPYGYVEYEYTGTDSYVESYYFSADQYNNLKNGDKVTIKYDTTDENTMWYGYVATVKEMTYEVTGLQEYVAAYGDINEDFITKLKGETEDTIYAYVANNYSNSYSLSNLEYAGYIFSYTKHPEDYPWYTNCIYVIYKGDVAKADNSISRKVYFPVCFRDLMVQEGTFSYDYKEGLTGYCYVDGVGVWTDGYVNPLSCYMDLVAYYEEDYNFECGDGFEEYASYTSISTLEDISAEYKTTLQTDAKTRVESYITDSYDKKNEVKDLALLGEYLLIAKEQGSDFTYNNRYIAVYAGKVTNQDGKFEETTVYYPIVYNGIVALPNGEYMYMECDGLQGYSNRIGSSYYYTNGYLDGTKMFSELVTGNRESYTYVVSEGLKQFGE